MNRSRSSPSSGSDTDDESAGSWAFWISGGRSAASICDRPTVNAVARSIAEAVAEYDGELAIYTLAGSEMSHAAGRAGLNAVPEFFADRPLNKDGSVVMFGW